MLKQMGSNGSGVAAPLAVVSYMVEPYGRARVYVVDSSACFARYFLSRSEPSKFALAKRLIGPLRAHV